MPSCAITRPKPLPWRRSTGERQGDEHVSLNFQEVAARLSLGDSGLGHRPRTARVFLLRDDLEPARWRILGKAPEISRARQLLRRNGAGCYARRPQTPQDNVLS